MSDNLADLSKQRKRHRCLLGSSTDVRPMVEAGDVVLATAACRPSWLRFRLDCRLVRCSPCGREIHSAVAADEGIGPRSCLCLELRAPAMAPSARFCFSHHSDLACRVGPPCRVGEREPKASLRGGRHPRSGGKSRSLRRSVGARGGDCVSGARLIGAGETGSFERLFSLSAHREACVFQGQRQQRALP